MIVSSIVVRVLDTLYWMGKGLLDSLERTEGQILHGQRKNQQNNWLHGYKSCYPEDMSGESYTVVVAAGYSLGDFDYNLRTDCSPVNNSGHLDKIETVNWAQQMAMMCISPVVQELEVVSHPSGQWIDRVHLNFCSPLL
jgi:hypothetical protein